MSTKNRFRTVEDKVRSIVASSLPDFKYLFMDYTQANVELDKLSSPHVIYILPPSGTLLLRHDKFRDKPRTQLWFVCPTEFDFDGAVNDCLIESLKRAAMKFFSGFNNSGLFRWRALFLIKLRTMPSTPMSRVSVLSWRWRRKTEWYCVTES